MSTNRSIQQAGFVYSKQPDPTNVFMKAIIPHVQYIPGDSKIRSIRPKLPSLHDYGPFQVNAPRFVYNYEDLLWFLDPDRQRKFKVFLKEVTFPQYRYIELQTNEKYLDKVVNLCIQAGCEIDKPSETFMDEDKELSDEERADIGRSLQKEFEKKEQAKKIFKPDPKKFVDMKVPELKLLAKNADISGFKSMRKDDLIENLTNFYKSDNFTSV